MNTILDYKNNHAKRGRGPDQLGWQKVGCLSHWKGKATNLLSPLQRFPHVLAVPAAAQGAAHFNHCPLELKAWHSCCVALLTRHSMLTQPGNSPEKIHMYTSRQGTACTTKTNIGPPGKINHCWNYSFFRHDMIILLLSVMTGSVTDDEKSS